MNVLDAGVILLSSAADMEIVKMKCPRCSSQIPSGDVACPECGARVTTAMNPRVKMAAIAVAVLLVVIVGSLILRAALSPGKSITQSDANLPASGPIVTNAPTPEVPTGPAITNAPSSLPPPPAPPSAEPVRNVPPKGVLDYLEFVKGIEARRQALLRDTGRALSMTSGAGTIALMLTWLDMDEDGREDPLLGLKQELSIHISNWYQLVKDFDSRPAPEQCAQFAGAYRTGLTTEVTQIYRIASLVVGIDVTSVQSMQSAVANLQQLKSDPNTQGVIDQSIDNANAKLAELSTQLGIEKPFDIKKETQAGGSIIGGL